MNNGPSKYDALIVDPDLDTRMRLKSATTSVIQFGKVNLLSDLDENQIEQVAIAALSLRECEAGKCA